MSSKCAHDIFATTRWSVIVAAGQTGNAPAARALEELCQIYWYPLYAYVRRRGHSREDAEDLTQAFFAGFLRRGDLAGLSAERGRFRAFLLAALKHFLANQWDRAQTQKRGGAAAHLSLDWESADTQFQLADDAQLSPDRAFDREWALRLLDQTIEQLRLEYVDGGKAEQFDLLKDCLTADRHAVPQARLGEALGLEPGAVRVAVHRLRKRYRQLLRREVAQTLADPQEVEEEMRTLFGAFRRS